LTMIKVSTFVMKKITSPTDLKSKKESAKALSARYLNASTTRHRPW
jgi:hypothetical protein